MARGPLLRAGLFGFARAVLDLRFGSPNGAKRESLGQHFRYCAAHVSKPLRGGSPDIQYVVGIMHGNYSIGVQDEAIRTNKRIRILVHGPLKLKYSLLYQQRAVVLKFML